MDNHPTTTSRHTTGRRRRAAIVALAATTTVGGALALGAGSASAIVDGTATQITEVPWQVSLQGDGEPFCGGSIIDPRVVLTAAHCLEGAEASDITVRAGVSDHRDSSGQDRTVERIMLHPDGFDGSADVALLVLDEPLETGDTVRPIRLATADELAAATRATVSGWGVTSENGDRTPTELQSADVPVIDDAACNRELGQGAIADDREMCAEGNGAGTCYGDSGGPLAITGADGTAALAGITSWGDECAVSPGVFAEVPAFADWIDAGVQAGRDGTDHPDGEGDSVPAEPAGERPDDQADESALDDGIECGLIDTSGAEPEILETFPCDTLFGDDPFGDDEFDDEFGDDEFDDEFGDDVGDAIEWPAGVDGDDPVTWDQLWSLLFGDEVERDDA